MNARDDAILTAIARGLRSEVARLQAQIDRLTTTHQEALYGFGRVHRPVIGGTRDLRAQRALEETGLSI